MPDDAFYYLILGRNFTLLHRWTFDGIAPATGFHLLWGYFIALIYWLVPTISLHQIFTLLYFAVALLIAASLALMCALVYRVFGPFAMLGPVALFCTSLAVQQPNFLMESGLVTFFSCVAIYKVFGCNTLPPRPFCSGGRIRSRGAGYVVSQRFRAAASYLTISMLGGDPPI